MRTPESTRQLLCEASQPGKTSFGPLGQAAPPQAGGGSERDWLIWRPIIAGHTSDPGVRGGWYEYGERGRGALLLVTARWNPYVSNRTSTCHDDLLTVRNANADPFRFSCSPFSQVPFFFRAVAHFAPRCMTCVKHPSRCSAQILPACLFTLVRQSWHDSLVNSGRIVLE